jgi:hypothetical protein
MEMAARRRVDPATGTLYLFRQDEGPPPFPAFADFAKAD